MAVNLFWRSSLTNKHPPTLNFTFYILHFTFYISYSRSLRHGSTARGQSCAWIFAG
jgi:hypothetical protein